MAEDRTAACTCGALKVHCVGEPVRISLCHCIDCKRRTGSAFGWNVTFLREQVTASGASSTYTRQADSGRLCTYGFCPACGATVFYEVELRPGRVSVPAGAFLDWPAFPPRVSVYGARQEPWLTLDETVQEE